MYQQMVNASEADPSAGSKLPLPHIASLPVPIRKEIEDRYSKAVTRAGKALAALGALEIPVWVTGSLARGKFTRSSDVDFVVDATGSRRMLAALVLEEALGDLPFHIVTFESVDDDAREFSMDGALDAAQFRARLA